MLLLMTISFLLSCCAKKEGIQLTKTDSEIYKVQGTLNGVVTIPMIVDSGASSVVIPTSLFYLLLEMDTIEEADFLPPMTSTLADGSVIRCGRFKLKTLKIGNHTFKNVVVSVVPKQSSVVLLGQNVLKEFGVMTIDYENNLMFVKIIED